MLLNIHTLGFHPTDLGVFLAYLPPEPNTQAQFSYNYL